MPAEGVGRSNRSQTHFDVTLVEAGLGEKIQSGLYRLERTGLLCQGLGREVFPCHAANKVIGCHLLDHAFRVDAANLLDLVLRGHPLVFDIATQVQAEHAGSPLPTKPATPMPSHRWAEAPNTAE
jgi:hypothetical protein